MAPVTEQLNITQALADTAQRYQDEIAVVVPCLDEQLQITRETTYTYGDLYRLVAQYQAGLKRQGYRKGDRIIILLPVTVEIYALILAIWSLGAVAVFLDPGIGMAKIITALQDSQAKAIVSIERLLKFRWLLPPLWFKDKYCADGDGLFLKPITDLKDSTATRFSVEPLQPQDNVLITYTGGTTGRAKGADRNARNMYNQFVVIRDTWAFGHEQTDFPSFPMFGLINICLGVKTVVPAVDFAKVGEQSSATIVSQIQQHQVTRMSGAPRFVGKLTEYAYANNIVLPSLQHMALGGAPITPELARKMLQVFPNADIKMVYGSTEVAPIAFVDLPDLIAAEGQGGIVGAPIPELDVRIVQLEDIHPAFDERGPTPFEVAAGEVGEIIIKGPHVVQSYVAPSYLIRGKRDNTQANQSTKIADSDGRKWHRTGDMGYFDPQGRLWLTGRKADVIQYGERVIHPYPIEQQLDSIPQVRRSAIIQLADQSSLKIAIEPGEQFQPNLLEPVLIALNLQEAAIHIVHSIPVDDRHNSKIDRIQLRKMLS